MSLPHSTRVGTTKFVCRNSCIVRNVSGKSEYRIASDGLLARVSGPWAQDKLETLSQYNRIVLRAVKDKWSGLCYIDLLAGGGRCILKGSKTEFDGSPLLAVKCDDPAFTKVVLVEADARLSKALRTRTAPAGARVTMIERVVTGQAMDLVVTFQISDLKRNAGLALKSDKEARRWDRFFGTGEWRKTIADFEGKRLQTSDLGNALGDFYGDRLATLGHRVRSQMNRAMSNTRAM